MYLFIHFEVWNKLSVDIIYAMMDHKVSYDHQKEAVMGKFYITLISLCIYFLSLQNGLAQCPQPEQLNIQTTDARSFKDNSGEIVFTFSVEVAFNRAQYRIRLWDHDEQRYVYDDNNPDFLNITEVKVDHSQISFTSLPTGKYALELYGGSCQYTRYDVSGHSEIKSK